MVAKAYRVSLWGDENILKMTVGMVVYPCEYANSHWIVQFKWVNYMVYLHLNEVIKFLKKQT